MAATELARDAASGVWGRGGTLAAWACAYVGVWAVTLTGAAVVAVAGPRSSVAVRAALDLTLAPGRNPPPSAGHSLALAAHNIPIAAWPLLLGVARIEHSPRARRAADILVLACLLVNAAPVGAALGAYGVRLLPYVPQLPLEWAGLALGYASWLVGRRRALTARERATWLAALVVVLIAAAVVESYAVPHR